MKRIPTIGSAVIDRLHQLGVRHIFGIPGDYVLSLYQLIDASPIQHVGTTREDCAGFAADAYARINGIGAVCVTYCVGGLNTRERDRLRLCRTVAGGAAHRITGTLGACSHALHAPHGAGLFHATRGLREDHGGRHLAG